jgi:myo-inositol 2-dehydrogenase/D-chiro-inositol 1-dehydrogenase
VTGVFAKASVLVDPMFTEFGDWDTAVLTLTLDNGALATIDNSRRAVYGQDQRVEVFGSKGMVAATNHATDRVVTADAEGGHSARLMDFFPERYRDAYRLEMQAFVDALRSGSPMPVTGDDGRRAVVIAMAADRSARGNRFEPIP